VTVLKGTIEKMDEEPIKEEDENSNYSTRDSTEVNPICV
jgi:hypothetical protein